MNVGTFIFLIILLFFFGIVILKKYRNWIEENYKFLLGAGTLLLLFGSSITVSVVVFNNFVSVPALKLKQIKGWVIENNNPKFAEIDNEATLYSKLPNIQITITNVGLESPREPYIFLKLDENASLTQPDPPFVVREPMALVENKNARVTYCIMDIPWLPPKSTYNILIKVKPIIGKEPVVSGSIEDITSNLTIWYGFERRSYRPKKIRISWQD